MKQKVVEYKGGEIYKLNLDCPLCEKKHEYIIKIEEVVVWYKASPEAYLPIDREIVLYCPINRDYFKVIFKIYYPYHYSKIKEIKLGGGE